MFCFFKEKRKRKKKKKKKKKTTTAKTNTDPFERVTTSSSPSLLPKLSIWYMQRLKKKHTQKASPFGIVSTL